MYTYANITHLFYPLLCTSQHDKNITNLFFISSFVSWTCIAVYFQVFMSKAEMKIHNANHMREAKPYKCSQCPKAFANSSYLSQHMRIHQGIKPYACDVCARKFTQLSHLQQHKRTHTGDKPYKCTYANCMKQFSQLSNLQSHSRCHQLDKPFKCNSCYKCFVDEQSLLDHIPRHLESKHLKKNLCIFCGSSYQQERALVKHFQQYHTDKPQAIIAAAIAAGTTGNSTFIASIITSSSTLLSNAAAGTSTTTTAPVASGSVLTTTTSGMRSSTSSTSGNNIGRINNNNNNHLNQNQNSNSLVSSQMLFLHHQQQQQQRNVDTDEGPHYSSARSVSSASDIGPFGKSDGPSTPDTAVATPPTPDSLGGGQYAASATSNSPIMSSKSASESKVVDT
ncbi:Zinc finger protein rotund, partial [Fragariocoptes setiger]